MRKRLIGVSAALGVLAAVGLGAAPAFADGVSYDYTDPMTTGCSADATTIASFPILDSDDVQLGTANVRYSAACGTNWVQVYDTLSGSWAAKQISRQDSSNPGLPSASINVTDADGYGYTYGEQLYAPGCIYVSASIGVQWSGYGGTSGTHLVC